MTPQPSWSGPWRGARLQIWRVAVAGHSWPAGLLADPDERARAERYLNPGARNAFIACRTVLRQAASAATGLAPEALALPAKPPGKPAFSGPAAGIHFNIAHSGGTALVALSPNGPLGIDLEELRPLRDAEALARKAFTAGETEALVRRSFDVRAFFACWTRKEAVVKALGSGIARDFPHFSVSVDPDEAAPAVRWLDEPAPPVELRTLACPGAIAALATWGPPPEWSLNDWPSNRGL